MSQPENETTTTKTQLNNNLVRKKKGCPKINYPRSQLLNFVKRKYPKSDVTILEQEYPKILLCHNYFYYNNWPYFC